MKSLDKAVAYYSIEYASKKIGVSTNLIRKLRDYIHSGNDRGSRLQSKDFTDIKIIEAELFRMIEEDPKNPLIEELQHKYVTYGMT